MKQLITIIFLSFGLSSFGQLNATITASDYEVCVGDTVLITMIASGGASPYVFSYTVNGGPVLTILSGPGDSTYFYEIYANPGFYTYTLISTQDSQGNIAQLNTSITVIVHTLPTATISGDTLLCVGDPFSSVTFTGDNGSSPYIFVYQIDDALPQTVTSTGNTAALLTPTNVADTVVYTLFEVTDSNLCAQDLQEELIVIIEDCAGVYDIESKLIDVFPNPTNGIINVTGTKLFGTEFVKVLDATGKVVYEGRLTSGSVNVSSIQSGFYLLEIEGYEGSRVGFIKE